MPTPIDITKFFTNNCEELVESYVDDYLSINKPKPKYNPFLNPYDLFCTHKNDFYACEICSKIKIKQFFNDFYFRIEKRCICEDCYFLIKEKEKKTYGWLVYHLLGLEKKYGRFIIKGEPTTENKYGLQRVIVNRLCNVARFVFYYGRSFCHRPTYSIPLKELESNKAILIKAIREQQPNLLLKISDCSKEDGERI